MARGCQSSVRVSWRRYPGVSGTTYRDYDGVIREIQRHAPTKAKAERALAEAVRARTRYDNGTEISPYLRVAALAEAWFRDVSAGDRSPSTLIQYRYGLDRQIIPAPGELRVRELTPGTIDRHLTAVTTKHGAAQRDGPLGVVGHRRPGRWSDVDFDRQLLLFSCTYGTPASPVEHPSPPP